MIKHTLGNPYPTPILVPALLSNSVGSGGQFVENLCRLAASIYLDFFSSPL